ncbi:peroxisomal membrane protein PEX14-like [Dioscorea cayenensis subsp. rotundata]|uniref:Peroxisomal membrane protein PEX14 n=1 Tax=Dioscorea cayennensis subsp. rotundata TaxID=55577 RepID=A0AB40B900_DIOCR|nr:peroxisomal membrane protein PEX14-like [Dioscorea cayenensis subsp. rotundata]
MKPMVREEMIYNAVNFLSDPNVRSSSIISRREFLEKKGLTQCEIDEAFRRVPDHPHSMNSLVEVAPMNQTNQAGPVTPVSSASTKLKTMSYWPHALVAIGGLAILGTGTLCFKNKVIPWLKTWAGNPVAEEDRAQSSLVQEAAHAAKSAAQAASLVANAIQELHNAKIEERMQFKALKDMMFTQVKQMENMSYMIQKLENRIGNAQYHSTIRNANPWRKVEYSSSGMSFLYPKNDQQLTWKSHDSSESCDQANKTMKVIDIEPEPEVSIPSDIIMENMTRPELPNPVAEMVNSVSNSNSIASHALESEQT